MTIHSITYRNDKFVLNGEDISIYGMYNVLCIPYSDVPLRFQNIRYMWSEHPVPDDAVESLLEIVGENARLRRYLSLTTDTLKIKEQYGYGTHFEEYVKDHAPSILYVKHINQ